ncbi:ATP-binding cassette domain-containing protein [Aliamphritea spongicola]|nr:ATP-binding cassette domain-containing protein [Aliamphritea spongicola]
MYAEQQSIQDQATDQPLLEIQNLAVSFMVHGSEIPAVKDVSFTIPKGKTVAIVGESGSGKSVTSQAILGILPSNGRISNGSIQYHCKPKNKPAQVVDIATLAPTSHAMRDLRGDEISIIFQEPMVSCRQYIPCWTRSAKH